MTAYIVGAADDFTTRGLEKKRGDVLIAADAGYARIDDKSVIDVVVGDFDSLGYVPDAEKVIKLRREKDDTDTDSAAKYAMQAGAEEIVFYGCLGGKLDHALANLQLGTRLARAGVKVRFVSKGFDVYFVREREELSLPAREKGRVSVFSPDETRGVVIRGLKYTLGDATLTNSYALGVSNEFTGFAATISAKEGILTVFVYEETDDIRS